MPRATACTPSREPRWTIAPPSIARRPRCWPLWKRFQTLQARLASGENTASRDYRNLLKAAEEGRVDVAFLDLQQPAEGAQVDAQHSRMLDTLAVEVLRHGGRVYPLPGRAAGELAPAAGLLRY